MEWNKETILHFISLIRERPAIWDVLSPEYKNKQKRHDAFEDVALLMGITIKAVNTKWTILRNQYSREKRRSKGRGSDPLNTTKWYAYEEMENLMASKTQIQSLNTETDDSTLTYYSSPSTPTSHTEIRRGKKRESDNKKSVYNDIQTLKDLREMENERKLNSAADDLTSYGLYIAAHLRKFSPLLQSKAKYEINNILYTLDMESMGECNASVSSRD